MCFTGRASVFRIGAIQNETIQNHRRKHSDGYIAYPLGIQGIVVGQGDTYEEAWEDVKSAIQFHIETFGPTVLEKTHEV